MALRLPDLLDFPATEEPEAPTAVTGSFNASEVSALARAELDFLAALAMPAVFKYCFPDTFKRIWELLTSSSLKLRDFSQLAIGLPRGFGKTMLIKLFVVFVVLFTKKQFILVICGTQGKANNILADIMSMLDEPNIKKVFGDWNLGAITDRQDLKRFGFRGRNIILMGAGAASDIRGITLENARPDIMIFDDIQTREDADSEVVSSNLETWMTGTAMKSKSPEGCLFVFIANMYPTKHSLLRKLKYIPTWTKFIAGGILAGGVSLWEELQPIDQLLKEFENDLAMGHPEVFYSEVLNDENASVNRYIDLTKIPEDPFQGELHQGNFIIIDPSNDKANSDAVSIGYFEVFDGIPVSKEIVEGRLSPGQANDIAIKMCTKYGCRLIAVEAVAYQYSFLYWFNFTCLQYGISGIQCVDIYPGVRSKNARILDMFKRVMAKEQYIGQATRVATFAQISSFNPLKGSNVDGILDLHTYAPKVLECYGHFIANSLTLQSQEYSAIEMQPVDKTSPF